MQFVSIAAIVLAAAATVAGHGAMVVPAPRSAHNQTLDERNKCGAANPYSKVGMNPGEYCGIGCLGDACLYYQIGCYAGCPSCSLQGKDLYPTQDDLDLADHCKPIEPTLGGGDPVHEHELRTNNIDGASVRGDWTKVNPWRAPGTAGRGNPKFEPCGINSGSEVAFPNPPTTAQDVPKAGPGTALPSVGPPTVWKRGSVVDASWALYANHGGGYSYRLCKKSSDGSAPTEACFQQTPLDFVGNTTTIHYVDGSRADFTIPAVTTNVGTFPPGSMWRKNPVPMCNCDIGIGCTATAEHAEPEPEVAGKQCVSDPSCSGQANGGDMLGCQKCGDSSLPAWSCAADSCCPGFKEVNVAGGYYCTGGSKPKPPTPSPNRQDMFKPYPKSYFHQGQTSSICPTGVQYPTMWDDGMGASGEKSGTFGTFMFSMIDQLKVPADLESGFYTLSWRWDCEETPQVWNSCADVAIA